MMNKLLKTFLILSLGFGCAQTISAQSEPVVTKKVQPAKTRDAQVERIVRAWSGGETDFRYHYSKVDLNSDNMPDAIVFIAGANYCGTGGCQMLILRGVKDGYALLTEMSVSRPPVWVGSKKTKGWSDLVIYVSGGGIKPYYSLLRFDGKTYPENPTVEPALPKKNRQRFVEYLSDIEDYQTGLKLK